MHIIYMGNKIYVDKYKRYKDMMANFLSMNYYYSHFSSLKYF